MVKKILRKILFYDFTSIWHLILFLNFSIIIEDLFHFFNSLSVLIFENLLSSVSDHLLKHVLIFDEEEFEPAAFTFIFNFDFHWTVNEFILLLDEFGKLFSPICESALPSDSFDKLENLPDENKENTEDDQIEKCKLDNQEENVNNDNQNRTFE